MIYSLNEILILEKSISSTELDKDILFKIKEISDIISDSNYKLTPHFAYKSKILKNRTEIDKLIDELRSIMNKISKNNFEKQLDKIKQIFIELKDSSEEEDIIKCSTMVFEIASINLFYSELYAKLYSSLYNEFESLKMPLKKTLKTFINSYKQIQNLTDPAKNYNIFCDILKNNERRIALLTFIINLMKYNIITPNIILDLGIYLQTTIDNTIESGTKDEVEQLTDNLYVIVKYANNYLESYDLWNDIVNYINSFKGKKPYKSLTYKTIFKFMDMQDILLKYNQDIK